MRPDARAPAEPASSLRASGGECDQPTLDDAQLHRVTVPRATDTSVLDDLTKVDRLVGHAMEEEMLEVIRKPDRIHDLG